MADDTFIRIEGVNALIDGDHLLDYDGLSNRDIFSIYEIANVLPVDFSEQFEKGNVGLIVAMADIALRKNGKPHGGEVLDALWDSPVGKITLVSPEDDALPPDQVSQPNSSGGENEFDETTPTFGSASQTASDVPDESPSGTGGPDSATGATSESETSET